MNFFNWINNAFKDNEPEDAMKVAVRVQSNPASTLFATTIMMLTELSKIQEEMLARSEKMKIAKRVEALGFTNAYEVAEQKQFGKNVELLRFMVEMWRDLGRNTMVIGIDQFRSLLHRYDLMCVPFSSYKGDIPTKNLQEIEDAMSKLNMFYAEQPGRYAYWLRYQFTAIRSSVELMELIRFPFYYYGAVSSCEEELTVNSIIFDFSPHPEGIMFIAAPKDFVEKPKIKRYEDPYRFYDISYMGTDKESQKVELANSILRGVSEYANVEYSPEPKSLPRNYDPFVCTVCKHGVIIHSMWGAEAEDSTIKRYEQLRDAIIEKGLIE